MSEDDLYKGWEKIRQLGEGGQSTVFLVRSPVRAARRKEAILGVGNRISGIPNTSELLESISEFIRPDTVDELGALKLFDKARRSGAPPEERIRREMQILSTGHASLPKFLDGDLDGKWMVTEYFPLGTLDNSPERFKGDALGALKVFRSLVGTVVGLHANLIIHRDIKPANVFIGNDGRLVLGDFGIAFTDEGGSRMTVTHERVGPWDYMPQWGDTGERLDKVKPSFDIYMLGKLLWCMVSGKLRLPREYHRRDEFNLSKLFPNDRRMHAINTLLDKCVVEHETACIQSASEFLTLIDDTLAMMDRGVVVNEKGEVSFPCLVCGRGFYTEERPGGRFSLEHHNGKLERLNSIFVRLFYCNVCTHRAFFSPGYPDSLKGKN
jgi:serine/threonine protein kinase